MQEYVTPSRDDYEEFLVQVVYGPCTDYLRGCIEASYLDFCRTMRGFAKVPGRNIVYCRALTSLIDRFTAVRDDATIHDQLSFDAWHKSVSAQITQIFHDNGFEIFAGQTQKWINMAFKNSFVCGERRVRGFARLYNYCHMPIDNVILDALEEKGVVCPSGAWSRWNYESYLQFQEALRRAFGNQPLLNVEHRLWLDGR